MDEISKNQTPDSGEPQEQQHPQDAQEQQERILVLTEWNPNPIIEINNDLKVTYTNVSARMKFPDLFELQASHPLMLGIKSIIHGFLETKSEVVIFERELNIDNIIYEQQILAIPKVKRVYLFMADLTKRREAENAKREMEEQLFQSQKMESMGQLTGGIAHDFNNILTVIQGNLQLLKVGFSEESKEMKRILAALTASERASNLSKRLLAFARREQLQPKEVKLKEYLNEFLNLLKPALGSMIDLKILVAEPLWNIYVDPGQLENAILNIAINAKDAMLGKGSLTLNVSNVQLPGQLTQNISSLESSTNYIDYVKISIKDTGSGISEETLKHIFDPFFTTKKMGQGTGLGLSQVYGFVTQSQGKITVETELGKGTTFNLFFPKISVKTKHEIEHIQSIPSSSKPKEKGNEVILIVEDECLIRSIVSEYLKELGYTVLEASNADQALDILKSTQKLDLIFSDIIMPGSMMGTDLVKEAVKLKPNLKVLLASGYTKENTDLGEFKLLNKPYKLESLAQELRQILDQK